MHADENRIEVTSASYRGPADRETAGPDKARTTRQAVKGWFKAAIRAIVQRDEDVPQPQSRRRSGQKEGGGPIIMRPVVHAAGRPAARGRYAKLRVKAPKAAAKLRRGFMRASGDIVSPYADADLYMLETLDTLNPCWPLPAGEHQAVIIDNDFISQQNHTFPQP